MTTIRLRTRRPVAGAEMARPLPLIPGASLGVASFATGGGGGELGGDFCNASALTGERWLLAVGDMEGKGPAAAFAAAESRRLLHDSGESGAQPHEMVALLNSVLAGVGRPAGSRPCAICVVSLRACPGGFAGRVCNGGSPFPMVVRAGGTLDELGGPGVAAGYFPEDSWNDWAFELGPGDALVMFTDGLPDSRSRRRFFGDQRLDPAVRKLARRHSGNGPAMAAALVAEARRFAYPRQPPDDILVLALSIPRES